MSSREIQINDNTKIQSIFGGGAVGAGGVLTQDFTLYGGPKRIKGLSTATINNSGSVNHSIEVTNAGAIISYGDSVTTIRTFVYNRGAVASTIEFCLTLLLA